MRVSAKRASSDQKSPGCSMDHVVERLVALEPQRLAGVQALDETSDVAVLTRSAEGVQIGSSMTDRLQRRGRMEFASAATALSRAIALSRPAIEGFHSVTVTGSSVRPTFRCSPGDDGVGILDVAGFAVNAVGRA